MLCDAGLKNAATVREREGGISRVSLYKAASTSKASHVRRQAITAQGTDGTRFPRPRRRRTCAERAMLDTIRDTFESYGFDALETPFLEYTDALGKFLPTSIGRMPASFPSATTTNNGSRCRYDLTAPLARYVAENQQFLPRPFRRYQIAPCSQRQAWPGRFREFIQCDAESGSGETAAAGTAGSRRRSARAARSGHSATRPIVRRRRGRKRRRHSADRRRGEIFRARRCYSRKGVSSASKPYDSNVSRIVSSIARSAASSPAARSRKPRYRPCLGP